jgi:outer membrane protein TolC
MATSLCRLWSSRVRPARWFLIGVAMCLAVGLPARARAQTMRLTLEDALRLAEAHSPALAVARAGEARAQAGQERADSQRLPQVGLSASYVRTLKSEFTGAFASVAPTCPPLMVDPSAPLDARVAELERAAACGAIGPSLDFNALPFGQRHTYTLTLSFSQALYAGGRITAERTQAALARHSADTTRVSARANLQLQVTRAFYDAALSDRLVAIAQAGYAQAGAAYDQAQQAFQAGRQSEFELLRARVARDNQQPAVIRREADRTVAYLRLRQLLGLAPEADVELVADLDAPALPPPAPFAGVLAENRQKTPAAVPRAPIDLAQTAVASQQAGVTVARAERLPTVTLTSSFGKVAYPLGGVWPSLDDFRTNWTIGATVDVPIFTGHRLDADERAAEADLALARARLTETRDMASLDAATAEQTLTAAEAAWQATAGTVDQAQRAYDIAELRYREGVSTELELSDARLSLQEAQANRAEAARDLQVARAHVALLPDLPIGSQ